MSSAGKKDRCSSSYSVWQRMEADLLVKIFTALSITDLVFGVSHVCQSWRSACQDPVLWEMVDLNGLCSNPSYTDPWDQYAVLYSHFCWSRLRTILNRVSDLAGNKVKRLLFDYRLRTKDEDLVFVARRFPGLKHLAIPNCNEITVEGFRNAIQIWTQLESLIIEYINKPCMIIRLIGVHCRNFSSLKIMFPFDLEFANSLFLYIPGLKVLSIRKTLIDRDALNYFLMLVDDLVALNISHSQIVVVHQASLMNHVSAEDVRASKVREFYWCDQSACIACRFRPSAETIFRCFEREMNLWRQDEIASLSC